MGFNVTAYSTDCKQLDSGEMCEDSWNEIEIAAAILEKYGFTYDILIYPRHIKYAYTLVCEFPYQKFIVDHLAKPLIKEGKILEAFEKYYGEEVVIQVNGNPSVTGKDANRKREMD